MKAFQMVLLVASMLVLGGCGEKAVGSFKTEVAASAVPAVTAKELTPEEKFAETKKKAEAGDTEAQYQLAGMYIRGDGVTEDDAKGIEWLQKLATQGNAKAQHSLGMRYLLGSGETPEDAAKAMEWLQKSAAQGNAEAQDQIGMMYEWGWSVSKDAKKAMEWYQIAAALGNASAQNSIGSMYDSGRGVTKDVAKALEWYKKAATQGNVSAQINLAWMYRNGEGVPKYASKAIEWYEKAAAQNPPIATAEIGLAEMYYYGEGVPKDVAKAFEWMQKAAAKGDAGAQYNLGVLYGSGEVINKNVVLAYAWSNLAAAKGNDNAKHNRDFYESQLTPTQRAEGQHLASNWKWGEILHAPGGNQAGPASPDGKPIKHSTGTAFAVSSTGHALTNNHVIEGCTEVKVAGREGVAKVITSDGVNDLALLQLPGKTRDIASLNPEPGKLRQGEEIIVFGYPLNSLLSSGGNLTPGIISALSGLDNNTNQIQITAPIQGGSSGSPVMDKKGNVVGVVSARLDMKAVRLTGNIPQNVNFAVNGQTVKAFLDANQVPYKTGGGLFSREKSNADIAEEARKWTVLVECWK